MNFLPSSIFSKMYLFGCPLDKCLQSMLAGGSQPSYPSGHFQLKSETGICLHIIYSRRERNSQRGREVNWEREGSQ